MPRAYLSPVLEFLRSVAGRAAGDGGADRALLGRFAAKRDEAAFTSLVERHGPMVLGVCRRVLNNLHDAEDAFQATFLVLARKAAGGLRPRTLASWLHAVALRTALKARTSHARRRARERDAARMPIVQPAHATSADVGAILDEEIARLPAKYRRAFILCYLEDKTNEEAAGILGCPKGTVCSQLSWARERLRNRLVRRGLASAAAVIGTELAPATLSASVPGTLAADTVRAALGFAWGAGNAGGASTSVIALTEGVLHAMMLNKVRIACVFLLVVGLCAAGAGILSRAPHAAQPEPAPAQKADGGQKLKDLRAKRLDAVRKEFEGEKEWFLAGKITDYALIFDVSNRLLATELNMADSRAARIAILQGHLSRMQELDKAIQSKFEVKIIRPSQAALGEFYRLDAEIRLEQEKAK
jgi:RNA polymerase sigma factor (sigma-70 family)